MYNNIKAFTLITVVEKGFQVHSASEMYELFKNFFTTVREEKKNPLLTIGHFQNQPEKQQGSSSTKTTTH